MPLDTELHKCAHKGDIQAVKALVESGEVNVNRKGAQDRTALHRAAGANHLGIILFLLQAGAPVDTVDRCLRTPLHWAAISGHLDATQLLLENGGDLRRKTVSGMNPLMCAVQQRWHSVAEAILEWSDGCSAEGGDGQTPTPAELCAATDAEGKTALILAKEHGDIPMQKLLKTYAPRKPSASCCGRGAKNQQLAAVVVPPRAPTAEGPTTAATAAPERSSLTGGSATSAAGGGDAHVSVTSPSHEAGGTKGVGGGGGRGWFRSVCFFMGGAPAWRSSRSGANPGATADVATASSSLHRETPSVAALAVMIKDDKSRGSNATKVSGNGRGGGVKNVEAVSSSSVSNSGTNLGPSASGKGVHAHSRGGEDSGGAGTLAMKSLASDNVRPSSSIPEHYALPPVENAPARDDRPKSAPMGNRNAGGGGKGARKSGSSSSSNSSRRHRDGHGREGGGSSPGVLGVQRSRNSRSGGVTEDLATRTKDERAGNGDGGTEGVSRRRSRAVAAIAENVPAEAETPAAVALDHVAATDSQFVQGNGQHAAGGVGVVKVVSGKQSMGPV